MDYKLMNRLNWMIRNKVEYFAPTISPAKKSETEIESLANAIEYYKDYTKEVIIQPKFMGSYCLVYLHKEITESRFQSRNGFIINHVNKDILINTVRDLHTKVFSLFPEANKILVEGELLPWALLGKGLIEREYSAYINVMESELEFLDTLNLFERMDTEGFEKFKLKEELKQHEVRQYKAFTEFIENQIDRTQITIFKRQLELFGREETASFQPFNLLKVDNEIISSNHYYNLLNPFEGLILDIEDSIRQNHTFAYSYFDFIKSKELEGVVVKPIEQDLINVAPALKVRTNNYLTLIYGVNYKKHFNKFLEKRNTKSKLYASISDYELARQLLRIDDYSSSNVMYQKILAELLNLELNNQNLDKSL